MKKKFGEILSFILVLVIAIGMYYFKDNASIAFENEMEIYFLDVGQGDSTLIKLPNDKIALIDGGSKKYSEVILNKMEELNISKVDYLIATHPHEDHIGGLPEVIRNIDVEEVFLPKKTNNTKIYEELLLTIKEKNIKVIEGKSGVNILNDDDLKFDVLGPTKVYKSINNNSIVARLVYGDNSFIFTGDAEKEEEKDILLEHFNIDTDVLKVGHHGSNTSTSDDFLEEINPKYAVISLGENNKYNHPDIETIDKLNKYQTEILRTDIMGDILILSDGKNIKVGE